MNLTAAMHKFERMLKKRICGNVVLPVMSVFLNANVLTAGIKLHFL